MNHSQATPVQITHVFVLRCSTQIIVCECAILIPVRVLLVIWCLIDNKVNNSVGEFWVLSLGFPDF